MVRLLPALSLLTLGCRAAAPPAAPPGPPAIRPAPATTGWGFKTDAGRWLHDDSYVRLDVLSTQTALGRRNNRWWVLQLGESDATVTALPCDDVRPTDSPDRYLCKTGDRWGLSSAQGPLVPPSTPFAEPAPGGGAVFDDGATMRLVDRDGQTVVEAPRVHALAPDVVVTVQRRLDTHDQEAAALKAGEVAVYDANTGDSRALPFLPIEARDGFALGRDEAGTLGVYQLVDGALVRPLDTFHRMAGAGRLLRDEADSPGFTVVDLKTGEAVGDGMVWEHRSDLWLARVHQRGFVDGLMPVWDPDARCGYLTAEGTEAFGFFSDWRSCTPFEGGRAVVQVREDSVVVDTTGKETAWR